MPDRTDPNPTVALAIGARLRASRKDRHLSLAEVAAYTEVSEATMSRIETGRSEVSAPHLFRLAALFGVDVGSFFHTPAPQQHPGTRAVDRKGQGRAFPTSRLSSQILSADFPNKQMQPFINTVQGTSLDDVGGLSAHNGEEYLLVQRGRLILHSAAYDPLLLEQGDCVYFDATIPHAYVSATPEGAEFLVVCTADDQKNQGDTHHG